MTENSLEQLKKTPLYDYHINHGGKVVDFAGWALPVQFSGILAEHHAVRNAVGIFDVSHMGEVLVEGQGAFDFLQYLTCNDLGKIKDRECLYSALTKEDGTLVDDIIINRFSAEKFFICVNASNAVKDFEWIKYHAKSNTKVSNLSADFAQIALQGPKAHIVAKKYLGPEVVGLRSFNFTTINLNTIQLIVARTGYTGEDGFEIYCPPDKARLVWDELLNAGSTEGIIPVGLGARDTLRLEACLSLYGHELNEEYTAIESGLAWIVKPEKGPFIGSEVLANQKKNGARRGLSGFHVLDPGIARAGDKLFSTSGEEIGIVTSGTKSPTLGVALGLAIIKSECRAIGAEIFVEVRGRKLKCRVVKTPFYKRTNYGLSS